MNQGKIITIGRTHAIQYRMPLKRPFGTSRHVTKATTNFLVRLQAEFEGRTVAGVGEAQPRNKLTGDVNSRTAWKFFNRAAKAIQGVTLQVDSAEEAIASIRSVMSDLGELADQDSQDVNRERPFRGSLLGIEIALLDLAARASDMSIAELLGGEQRDQVLVTASTTSTENTPEQLRVKTTRQAHKYPMNRVKGRGDQALDLYALKIIHSANVIAGDAKSIWMDINEGYDEDAAWAFLKDLSAGISAGELPETITIEQPVPKALGGQLPVLQRKVDELTAQAGIGDIRVMPDESLWDINDLESLHDKGGCRAINIKTAKAGGLIASLDTARRAVELNPDVYIYIGGMIGTSDLTTWAIHQLVKALPRIDYLTAVPPGNVAERISEPLSGLQKGTSLHRNSKEPGLGASLAYDKLAPFIVAHSWYPTPEPSPLLRDVNVYPEKHLRGFKEKQVDNHVLEKEALALGLSTVRTSPVDFIARDVKGAECALSWTKSNMSATVASGITGDKQATRDLLRAASVAVPIGRRFELSDVEEAINYVDQLGFPVVFKPLRGTGGKGVIPGITSSDELRWAFERAKASTVARAGVVVEEHFDGREFRIFALRERALSAVERRPGRVQGDGHLTIAELMLQKHEMRMQNPHLRSRKIRFGDKARLQLQRQNLDFDSVLPKGQTAVYTLSPSFHQGGESVEMLDNMHPSILEAAAAAVRAIPTLAYAGVDFIVPDPAKPLEDQRAGILELNAHPAQSSHEFPMLGKRSRVSREIVRFVAHQAKIDVQQDSCESLNLRLLIRGDYSARVRPMEWVETMANARNLSGWVKQWGATTLECHISGSASEAASLISAASRGGPGIRVSRVEADHNGLMHTGEFEVRS